MSSNSSRPASDRSPIDPARRLRRTYTLALAVLALIGSVSFAAMNATASGLESDASVINIAGRQRMLSQRIAAKSALLASSANAPSANHDDPIRKDLEAALETFVKSHHDLKSRDEEAGLGGVNPPHVVEKFALASPHLNAIQRSITELIEAHAEADIRRAQHFSKRITSNADSFLPIMNQIVFDYEDDANSRRARLERIEMAAFASILGAIIFVSIAIFEPFIRKQSRLYRRDADQQREIHRLGLAISRASNSVIFLDEQLRITWINPGFTNTTGYGAYDAIGKTPADLLHCENTDPDDEARLIDAASNRTPTRTLILNRDKAGDDYWFDVELTPTFDENHNHTGFLAIGNDVTELVQTRRRATDAANSASDHRRILDQHTFFSITDARGTIIDANAGFCAISGYTRQELIGNNHRILNSGHHPKSFWKEMYRTVHAGDSWRGEVKNRAKDGSFYWVDATNIPQFDSDGNITRIISLRFEITGRKFTEQNLVDANTKNELLASAIDLSPDPLTVADAHGNVVSANPAAVKLAASVGHETHPDRPSIACCPELVPTAMRDRIFHRLHQGNHASEAIASRPANPDACLETDLNGNIWIQIGATPIMDGTNKLQYILFATRDITADMRTRQLTRLQREGDKLLTTVTSILHADDPISERFDNVLQSLTTIRRNASDFAAAIFLTSEETDELAQVSAIGHIDAAFEHAARDHLPWLTAATGAEYIRATAHDAAHYAVPITAQNTTAGILIITADADAAEPKALRPTLTELGEMLGQAVAKDASERRIREQRHATEQLAQRLEIACNAAEMGIWDFDPKSGQITWDAWMHRLYNTDPQTTIPDYDLWKQSIHPDDREDAVATLEHALEHNLKFDTRFRLLTPSGETRHLRALADKVIDHNGVERVVGINFDISQQILAQDDLEEAQRIGRVGSWRYDVESGKVNWSNQLFAMLGRDHDTGEPDFEGCLNDYTEESARDLAAAVEAAIATGEPYSLRVELREHVPSMRYALAEGRTRRAQDGTVRALVGTLSDITEQVRRENNLREITTALDAAGEGVFILDVGSSKFVYANQGIIDHLGYDRDELLELGPEDIDPDFGSPAFKGDTEDLFNAPGSTFTARSRHRRKDGTIVPVEIIGQYMPDLGEQGRIITIVRDITQRLAYEKSIEDARVAAEAASLAKSEFLANMSHEIRTPMTAILGYADLIADPHSNARDFLDHVSTIRTNANHLLTIINDILDMSKIEAGKLTVETIATDPAHIVEEVVSLVRPRAIEKNIDARIDYRTPIPQSVTSDPTRLRQILLNLAGNAIKFTDTGTVTLAVSFDTEQRTLTIAVEDTGIGMTPSQRDSIARFDAFSQADNSTTRKFGGTGLGLRISNSLANMLGGSISIQSAEGKGSIFGLTIHVATDHEITLHTPETTIATDIQTHPTSAAPAPQSQTPTPLLGTRVLLAEDGPDNQRLIRFHLEKAGADVTIADNGRIAVDTVTNADPDARPHVILMDMQMPELDGYSATRELRNLGHTTPIIALTAHAMDGDREKCIAAGCDDYATKPINREKLIQCCTTWAQQSRHREAA